jgi:hypothetical protein
MANLQDLPGASEFLEVLTLFVLSIEYPNEFKNLKYSEKNYKITGISASTFNDARRKALKRFYGEKLDLNFDNFSSFINVRVNKITNPVIRPRFITSQKFLANHYDNTGKFKSNVPAKEQADVKSAAPAAPAPLVPVPSVKPAPSAKPSKPQYKTREQVIQELMSQGKITDPSQAVALSSPVTVNGRTFQALISPLGTLPGPGGVRVPIINDQQANTYAMSILREYNKLAGVGYQPLNDIGKKNLDPKNVEPLKKLLTRIDLAVNNKTSHEQTADGEPILPQMREPKLSADTENLYNILKRLSGQTLGSIAQPDKAKSSVNPAVDTSTRPSDPVKKNDVNTSPVTRETSVLPADIPVAGINTTRKPQISDSIPKIEVSIPPIRQRVPKFNTDIIKDDTLDNVTPPNQVIDSKSLFFQDDTGQKIPGSDNPNGFFEYILEWLEASEYYNVSNKMSEADFIKRVSDCNHPKDINNTNKCWTEFPEFIMGKLSSILGTYRTPDNKIYKTLTRFIPIGTPLNIQMIMNLIEANDQKYSNLSESFIGVK